MIWPSVSMASVSIVCVLTAEVIREIVMSLKVTWFGHATWLLEQAGLRILVDPFLDDNPQSPVKADEVVCDTILVTHGHADHIADAALIARKNQAPVYASYEVASWLAQQGVSHTVGMNLGGGCATKFGEVRMVPAWHSSSLPDGSYGGPAAGFLLTWGTLRLYLAGDTALFSDMQLIARGGLDLAILPIGDLYTMGPDDSVQAIEWLRPRFVLPSHYGTWPPISQDAEAWARRVQERTSAQPVVIRPGQSWVLPTV